MAKQKGDGKKLHNHVRGKKWEHLRLEFINSDITLMELSKKHNVKYLTVKQAAYRGKWLKQRSEVIEAVTRDTYKYQIDMRGEKILEFNENCLKLAKSIMGLASRLLKAEDKKPLPSATMLQHLIKTIKEAQYVGRLALGISTSHIIQIDEKAEPEEIKPGMGAKEASNLYIEMIANED